MNRTVLIVLLVAVVVAVVYFGVSPAKAAAATTVPKPPLIIGDELAPEVRARVEATREIRREVSAGNLPPSALPAAAGPTGAVKNVVAEGIGAFNRALRNARAQAGGAA